MFFNGESICSKMINIIHSFCIPESFNTKISHQLFDFKITFVNSHSENKNSKGDFVLKNWFETSVFKISGIQRYI